MRHAPWILALAVLPGLAVGQLPADFDKKVDAVCKEWDKPDAPGGVVGVALDGKLVFAKGYGLANLEAKAPNTPETVMDVGSVSKQFTAMCILLLEEQGKLKTSDDVTKYVPELPTFGKTVSLDNLLHMTSGLRDYLTLMAGQGWNLVDQRTVPQALETMCRQTGANSDPGARFNYCNGGYVLLGIIVQRVSGLGLAEFAKKNIFEPLGMKDTSFVADKSTVIPHCATSYSKTRQGTYQNLFSALEIIGDGGLHTTVGDLAKWHENFYANKLGKGDPKLTEKMVGVLPLNNGKPNPYACGLMVDSLKGEKRVQHGGNWLGFNAMTARYPDKHLSVFALGNDGTNESTTIATKIAEIVLGKADATSDHKEIELGEAALKAYPGVYELPEGRTATVSVAGKQLAIQVTGQPQVPLFAEAPDKFFLKVVPATIEFLRDEKGEIRGCKLQQSGVTVEMKKGVAFVPTEEQMKAFVGRYRSFDMDMTVEVTLDNGKLNARYADQTVPVNMTSPDKAAFEGMKLDAMRDATGALRGFTLDMGRASGMKFIKES